MKIKEAVCKNERGAETLPFFGFVTKFMIRIRARLQACRYFCVIEFAF
jgi:hypothetical protein